MRRPASIKEAKAPTLHVNNLAVMLGTESAIDFFPAEVSEKSLISWVSFSNASIIDVEDSFSAPSVSRSVSVMQTACCANPKHDVLCPSLHFVHFVCESCNAVLNQPLEDQV